jgi:hypothetical protein
MLLVENVLVSVIEEKICEYVRIGSLSVQYQTTKYASLGL